MKNIIIIALLFIIAALIERKTKATDTIAPASNIQRYPYNPYLTDNINNLRSDLN